MTTEELKEEYGAECVDLTSEASRMLTIRYALLGCTGKAKKEDTIRKAILLFDEAIKANPKYPYAYHYQAQAYANLKDYDKAIECLKKCEELLPKEEQGTNYFIQALLEYKRGQQEEMTKLFKHSLKINNEILKENPYNLVAIGEKVYLLSILGQKDEAQRFLDSYKGSSKIDQKSLDFFCEAIKTKHLISKLASDI